MPETAVRRLAGSLLLSGLLHLGAGYWAMGPAGTPGHLLPAPLRVELRPPAEPLPSLPDTRASMRPRSAPASPAPVRIRPVANNRSPPPLAAAVRLSPANDGPPAARADAATLIERGTAAWREEIRQASARAERQPRQAFAARPADNRQDDGPEVERLAGDLVRVTLPGGRRYCLQAPAETLRQQMPTPLLALPSNCP